ncbi:hypothetical protein H2201_003145 [Coniosporium apollinis]|uniref:Glycosyltransferase 2-like domain-containing protein n=2 Tax=Coniosporium TaxID=2810619 RepID=A0ABQ9P0D6_9PEZI|nr:hypothetical protein H2199_008487 [Cladosporium sp. JES 115]KAJ9666741.1 hypothetical protein H2201_003145 [Coniosporium apollinis]
MGFFKKDKPSEKEQPRQQMAQLSPTLNEKGFPQQPSPGYGTPLVPPSPGFSTPPMSGRASVAGSVHSTFLDDIKHEVMVNYLFQQQCGALWVGDGSGEIEGVLLRKSRGNYMACPPQLAESAFAHYCAQLNVQVAMTVNSRIIKTFLQCAPDAVDVPLMNGLRVQILPTIDDLPKARKHQFAAFIASEALLIVWDDEAMNIINRAKAIENELMQLVWKTGEVEEEEEGPKKGPAVVECEIDEESGEVKPEKRPTHIMNSVLVGFTLLIITVMLGAGFRQIAIEVMVDKGYARLALLVLTPIQIFFTLFFAQVIVGCIAQCIGPVRQMTQNSRYYSALLPRRITGRTLPHITIQCPVYKEGLASVIAPTVKSIKQAMSTYELQGGSANMFINDDGLQIIGEEERQARIEFYADHSIGWTARPKHGENGFTRRGKFKKASNMNFGLMISNNVEEKLAQIHRPEDWSQNDEAREYERCLKEVLEENGRAWADGNIRVGDYIILIDSDTRVPADCLLDAASEMEQSPEVGIMQFSSGVMQVVHTYFENGITFFTNLIYTAIRYTVSNGDVAPFVGHNAILRWSAIQQVSFFDEDGYEKFWSESHVSEDFDMSLRLQCNGYIIRLAAWAGEGFKEGVSLTVYDELARWEKYAYGCNELLFHPMRLWLTRGPFTELFRRFLFSNIRFTSKVTIVSYIGTYYAIGAAWILTTANYFAIGWFNGYLDKYYIDSWKVWFSIVIVFNGLGNVALAIMRYRIGDRSFFGALLENLKWILMLAIFLGGLSLHVSQALLAHMFEIDMTWGATSKEAEFSNFFIEVPKVLKSFKYSIAFAVFGIVGMIFLAVAPWVPYDWKIRDFVAILPMATVTVSHLLLPIALNPALMTFSW